MFMDDNYYNQLHETSRHYNTQMWAIPAAAFGLLFLALDLINFEKVANLLNTAILLSNRHAFPNLWPCFCKN